MDWLQNLPPGGVDRPFNPAPSNFSVSSSSSQSLRQRSALLARYGVNTPSQSHVSRPPSTPATAIVERTSLPPVVTAIPDAKIDDTTDSTNTPWLTPPPSSDRDSASPIKAPSLFASTDDPWFPTGSPSPRIPSPTAVEHLIESKDGKLTINGITPQMLSEWEDLHPFVRESDHINYEYDGSTSRMIIRCTVSPVHDSLQIFFKSHASAALLDTLSKVRYIESVQMSSGSSMSNSFRSSPFGLVC